MSIQIDKILYEWKRARRTSFCTKRNIMDWDKERNVKWPFESVCECLPWNIGNYWKIVSWCYLCCLCYGDFLSFDRKCKHLKQSIIPFDKAYIDSVFLPVCIQFFIGKNLNRSCTCDRPTNYKSYNYKHSQ